MPDFKIVSDLRPTGDQPRAIEELIDGLNDGLHRQTLLGVTGSGKTFTMANVIERLNRAALLRIQRVLSPQRDRIFCLLLRLLPARGVRRPHRYVHRKRLGHQ